MSQLHQLWIWLGASGPVVLPHWLIFVVVVGGAFGLLSLPHGHSDLARRLEQLERDHRGRGVMR